MVATRTTSPSWAEPAPGAGEYALLHAVGWTDRALARRSSAPAARRATRRGSDARATGVRVTGLAKTFTAGQTRIGAVDGVDRPLDAAITPPVSG